MSTGPMRPRWMGGAAIAVAAILLLPSDGRAAETATPPLFLPFSYPPDGSSMMGEENAGRRAPNPGITAPLVPPAAKMPAALSPPRSHAQLLDDLFQRLAAAQSADEAKAAASRIQILWFQSGSDTADLLMSRAAEAVGQGHPETALHLLDTVVVLQPEWVEAWNKRADVRLAQQDEGGAMEDLAHVLLLEPRHFGALSAMASVFHQHGMNKDALQILHRIDVIYPHNEALHGMIDALTLAVEGRPI